MDANEREEPLNRRLGGKRRDTFVLCLSLAAAGTLGIPAACSSDRASTSVGWEAVVDTVGDTIVVRTVSGSEWRHAEFVRELRIGTVEGLDEEMLGDVWGLAAHPDGDIYVYDRLVPAIRRYASDGTFLRTIGRRGGGPGEYQNADIGGLAVLADGRLLLRDPGNGRFTVYTSAGDYLDSWSGLGGALSSRPIVPATDGGFFHHSFVPLAATTVVTRYDSGGTPMDTIPVPIPEMVVPTITARREGGPLASRPVPYSPTAVWAINRKGEFFTATTNRYEIDRHRIDGTVLRVARDVGPVPLSAAERAAARDGTTEAMRRIDPEWQWSGPPVPSHKPIIRQLYPGTDGRLWVLLHQESEPVSDDSEGSGPSRFQEPSVFDVFDDDGRYLGQVTAPEGFSLTPPPIFGSQHGWAVVRDHLDVPYVARFRLMTQE